MPSRSIGLAGNPKILAVGEPCPGLAEAIIKRVYEALAKVHAAMEIIKPDGTSALYHG